MDFDRYKYLRMNKFLYIESFQYILYIVGTGSILFFILIINHTLIYILLAFLYDL